MRATDRKRNHLWAPNNFMAVLKGGGKRKKRKYVGRWGKKGRLG